MGAELVWVGHVGNDGKRRRADRSPILICNASYIVLVDAFEAT